MDINRNNYESFFLLYIDRELTDADRRSVEDFLFDNPDLHQEMAMMQDMILTPEPVYFPGKESILHEALQHNMIHAGNREEMFVLYADNELTTAERAAVERFAAQNHHYRHELEAIQAVRLTADKSVVFKNKRVLLRRQPIARPMIIRWLSASAAACLLLIGGILWRNQAVNTQAPLVKTPVTAPDFRPMPARADQTGQLTTSNNRKNPAPPAGSLQQAGDKSFATGPRGQTPVTGREMAVRGVKQRKETSSAKAPPVAGNAKRVTRSRPLPPVPAPAEKPAEITPVDLAASEPAKPTGPAQVARQVPMVDEMVTFSEFPAERNDAPVLLTNIADENKNSLRGLFRKAARVVERNASQRTAKKTGIHIGNLEIAFN